MYAPGSPAAVGVAATRETNEKKRLTAVHIVYILHIRYEQTAQIDCMKIVISNAVSEPIYEQIVRQIRSEIIVGNLSEGSPLPSIRKLALELQISVITTKRAYEELEAEGFINTVGGKGTFVAAQNPEFLREKKMRIVEEKLAEAVAEARSLGIRPEELHRMLTLLQEGE